MDNEQLRQTLENETQRLESMREDLRDSSGLNEDQRSSIGELSVVDQHPADVGTEENQRAVNLSLLEQIEAELSDVESALQKLDQGTYGTCEACGEQIDEARLQALPATRFCINDQSQTQQTPPSEQADPLNSPMDRSPAAPI